jgi:hypothetical protein
MAIGVNELIGQRTEVFKGFKRAMRSLDTVQEKAERFINQVLQRKAKIPDAQDYQKLIQMLREIGVRHDQLVRIAESSSNIFTL